MQGQFDKRLRGKIPPPLEMRFTRRCRHREPMPLITKVRNARHIARLVLDEQRVLDFSRPQQ